MKTKVKIIMVLTLILFSMSCSKGTCPTNDRMFFYRKAGVAPTKAYMRWGNL